MRKNILLTTVFIICFLLSNVNGIILLPQNASESPIVVNTPAFIGATHVFPPFNVTSIALPIGTTAAGFVECDKVDPNYAPFLKGAIAIVGASNGCPIEQHIQLAQGVGAVGVIVIIDLTWSICRFSAAEAGRFNITIPAVCIESSDFVKYLTTERLTKGLFVTFDAVNNRYRDEVSVGAVIFCQIINIGLSVAGLASNIYKIIIFSLPKYRSTKVILPLIIFSIMIIANLNILVEWIDFFGYYGGIFSFEFYYGVVYTGWPFTTSMLALVTYHFTSIALRTSGYEKFMFLPIIYVFLNLGFIVTINFVGAGLLVNWRAERLPTNLLVAINGAVQAFNIVFFFTGGILFMRKLQALSTVQSTYFEKKKKGYIRLSVCILFLGLSQIMFFIAQVAGSSQDVRYNPPTYFGLVFWAYIGNHVQNWAQFFMFQDPDADSASGGSKYPSRKEDMHKDSVQLNNEEVVKDAKEDAKENSNEKENEKEAN